MGHPDKMCDQISDAVLDALLEQDPRSRVACETLTKTGFVMLAGEVTTTARIDYEKIARGVIRDIGYTDSAMGFDAETCGVLVALGQQSPDIARGVDTNEGQEKLQGAGDQGMMFGYACDETEELMPAPIRLAHRLMELHRQHFEAGTIEWLRPDAKSQVTVEYGADGRPGRIDAVVLSTQHDPDVGYDKLRQTIVNDVIRAGLPSGWIDDRTVFHVNPTGRFVIGGPMGDAGLTGRKIIVDTYGGMGRHGGGAFSGKDPSKVDRSAAYYARYIAKHLVAAGLANRCEVQLAYAIGVAEPVSVLVQTFGTSSLPEERLAEIVVRHFDARPGRIIEELDLLRPIYSQTAAYGHFGREEDGFTWEKTPKLEALKAEI